MQAILPFVICNLSSIISISISNSEPIFDELPQRCGPSGPQVSSSRKHDRSRFLSLSLSLSCSVTQLFPSSHVRRRDSAASLNQWTKSQAPDCIS